MTTEKQMEQFMREEIVFRALVCDAPQLAGIFAENRMQVQPDLIALYWNEAMMGSATDSEMRECGRGLTEAVRRLGIPHLVIVKRGE